MLAVSRSAKNHLITYMSSITAIANDFFAACETGKGWEACKTFCSPNATFAAQAEPLAGIKTLAEYADWMKGLLTIMPDGSYEVKSFATDTERNNVAAYAVFNREVGGRRPPREDHLSQGEPAAAGHPDGKLFAKLSGHASA